MIIRTHSWRLKKRIYHVEDKTMDAFVMIAKVHRVTYDNAFDVEENDIDIKQSDPISTESLLDETLFSQILDQFLSTVRIKTSEVFGDHNRILSICRAMTSIDTIIRSTTAVPVFIMDISIVIKPDVMPMRALRNPDETPMRRALRDSMVEDVVRTVPAKKSSVAALQTEMLLDGCSSMDQCVICFEEFRIGFDMVTHLPCNHIYHRDCIFRWLETSYFCPVCHYEFPTN
ncbi:uncharacterized protein LOC132300954 [Cornus florida]|uniref:uncharacterized protein LOC132300954 n=1 Tax=Cornus florida TaxID=4283 RepID=UPI002898178A|nr:uncharacterized protein LOC132300954 [Cornus florida]